MGRLLVLLFLAYLALLVIALIDCLSTDDSEIRALPKVVWVFLILLFSPIGSIMWLRAGRPRRVTSNAGRWASAAGFGDGGRARRQVAPDDDPDFLRRLAQQRADDDALRQWEADLRRRDEDRHNGDGDDPTPG